MVATTIEKVVLDEIHVKEDEIEKLKAVLGAIPRKVLDIEMESISLWNPHWFRIRDASRGLCARLLSAGLLSWNKRGRKKATSAGTQTTFFIPLGESECISFDVVQPGKDCKTVRVQITEERIISVCGELPSNYEIVEVLDDSQEK